ncbi:MAG: phosphoadenylyl-sulfate reductase [Actinomycetota bacterium]
MTTLDSPSVHTPLVDIDLAELAAVSREMESKPASAAIRWAHERFADGLVLAASFQDCVLVDIAVKAAPEIEVVFLDTQYHFAETLWYVERVRERYDLNLRIMEPLVPPDDLWQIDTDECCAMRKVEPLARALQGKQAWMSGVRRSEAPSRANAQILHLDVGRGIVKVNPLAPWSDADVEAYKRDHGLLEHPLVGQGYPSIGCWPCTRAVAPGDDPRSGRWSATGKTECGLHGWPSP